MFVARARVCVGGEGVGVGREAGLFLCSCDPPFLLSFESFMY